MTTIYLSSTYEDLKDYRKAVFDALRQSGYQVIAMEDYVARDDRPLKACLDDVDRADIYVGLFAFRYGYMPPKGHGNPDGLSITELEFRRADASPTTHCLVFLANEEARWSPKFMDICTGKGEGGKRIRQLRDELACAKMGSFFSEAYELASKVQSAVSKYLASKATTANKPTEETAEITWDVAKEGSPYPGLLHFTRRFAPVFFGRETEVRELLDRLTQPEGRFVIVSGDSGSGKSSLVDAGVLSRLESGIGERSLQIVRMVPSGGQDPFDALRVALHPFTERAGLNGYQLGRDMAAGKANPANVLQDILKRGLEADELLLFLDQMEELFTASDKSHALVTRFLSGLYAATQTLPLRVLSTIRSDLLHHCYEYTDMLAVLNGPGHYALGRAASYMLHDMIVRPAQCAGVTVPEVLARQLIGDLGSEPGHLPLLAFALQRLFDEHDGGQMSEAIYQAMGGLTGAIAEHVEEVERELSKALQLGREQLESRFAGLFESLVQVDIEGLPTRRRARQADLPKSLSPVVEVLIRRRLLASEGKGQESTLSVAHERLFQAWPALARWVATHQDDLRLLRQGELDAAEWYRQDCRLPHLWHTDRLAQLQQVIESQPPERVSDAVRTFAWPQQSLICLLDDPDLKHETRETIGRCLAVLGDPRQGVGVQEDGTPAIDWVAIPGGEIELKDSAGRANVAPFHISRYLVTNVQFHAFVDAEDGYTIKDWWQDMPPAVSAGLEKPRWSEPNRPRETVSWYEAVAFCRWLSQRLGFEVRLPTEFEWQQAATGGDQSCVYPWGKEWDERCCNTSESGLNRTTAVGLYPDGASIQGVLDFSGNLREWCLSKYEAPEDTIIDDSIESRVLRGGSWSYDRGRARSSHRQFGFSRPASQNDLSGFRLVCLSPIR